MKDALRHALFAAAMLFAARSLQAQAVPPPADTTQAGAPTVRRDSVKAPFPGAETPPPTAIGRQWRWERDQIFQASAVTLAELLADIPGAHLMRSGYILSPQVVAWHSDLGRVRVFVDGIELDPLDAREGRVRDLGAIPIWYFEEVVAEAMPGELRVHARTWRVTRTTPQTRVDVLTGDEDTNLYRGFYGRRFQSGLGFQFGFQQMSTVSRQAGGDGDGLSLFARFGVAREHWSVDVVTQRASRTRNATLLLEQPGSVPALTGSTSTSSFRFTLGSPDADGLWAQLIASANSLKEETPPPSFDASFGVVPADSVDTTAFRAQYVASAGATKWGLKTSATVRYRRALGEGRLTPSVRAAFVRERFTVHAMGERNAEDSALRADVALRVVPFSFFAIRGGASRRSPFDDGSERETTILEAAGAIRVMRYWFEGGVVTRDSTRVPAPVVFARGIVDTLASAATGFTYGIWGPLYRAISIDIRGTRWETAHAYRPVTEVRARAGLDTEWRSKFPRGDFTLRLFGTLHYRGPSFIPLQDANLLLPSSRVLTTLVEVRIKSATIAWQYRNALGAQYQTVPGYRMPSFVNLYGVRWNFTN